MDTLLIASAAVAGPGALLLRWRRPAWYWLAFGALIAVVRLRFRWASVMEACGLTVPPSRLRLALARATRTEVPASRVPRILRLRLTRSGLVLRVKMRPGQDAFDFAASTDRLRHGFGMQGVTSREVKAGVVELRMTGYDVLKHVQMPAKTDAGLLRVPVALCEDGSVRYRDYRQVPHALNVGAIGSGKSVYQRGLVAGLAPQRVALVGIDCKNGVELAPLARRFSALADNPDDALGRCWNARRPHGGRLRGHPARTAHQLRRPGRGDHRRHLGPARTPPPDPGRRSWSTRSPNSR